MWRFQHFIKDPAKAALAHRVCAPGGEQHQLEGKLTSYCEIVSYLLETYATGDVTAEAETDITSFEQSENMTAIRYAEVLWEKALRCGRV